VSLGVFDLGSQQGNKFDPMFYSGENPSPRLATEDQLHTYDHFLEYVDSTNPVLTGDQATIYPFRSKFTYLSDSSLTLESSEKVRRSDFNHPGLRNLEEGEFSYLVTNEYILERGMSFQNVRGLAYNESQLKSYRIQNNKIWDSGVVNIYNDSEAAEISE